MYKVEIKLKDGTDRVYAGHRDGDIHVAYEIGFVVISRYLYGDKIVIPSDAIAEMKIY